MPSYIKLCCCNAANPDYSGGAKLQQQEKRKPARHSGGEEVLWNQLKEN